MEQLVKVDMTQKDYLLYQKYKSNEMTLRTSFVVSVAKQYQDRGKSQKELIEVGNKGLEFAARKFTPKHGFKFISYAHWGALGQISLNHL